ncbi:hypothetical protein JCM8208_004622 [Rhodotorula glutinis]
MDNMILDDSTSSSASATCHLLRLPNELLDGIFSLVYARARDYDQYDPYPAPLNSPLSRRLYRAQQPFLYRLVVIDRYADLRLLRDTVRDVPGVGAYVDEVVLCMAEEDDEDAEIDTAPPGDEADEATTLVDLAQVDQAHVDPAQVDPAHLCGLLEHLPHLKVLRITHLDLRLLRFFFADERVPMFIAQLEFLSIVADRFVLPTRATSGDWVAQLARYPALTTLDIHQPKPGHLFPPVETPGPVLAALKVLHLSGEAVAWSVDRPLDDVAPNLDELHLNILNHIQLDSRPALSTAPVGLRRLRLESSDPYPFDGPIPVVRVHEILPPFNSLVDLTVGPHILSSPDLLVALRQLPALEVLVFTHRALVSDILLSRLVAGPLRPPSLRRLILDHVISHRGSPVDRTSSWPFVPQSEADTPRFRMSEGWYAPRWPRGGTAAGLFAAIEAARLSGIVVTGSAVDYFAWEVDFAREMRSALLLWGEWTGDYVEARRALGHAVVDEHIEGVRAAVAAAGSSTGVGGT